MASLGLSPVVKDIIIVDNGATDPAVLAGLERLAARSDVRVIRHDAPFNFAELCNLGARQARYDTLLFLNDDVEALDGDWLGAMLAFTARPDVGVVGARLLYPSRDLQHAGVATNLIPGPGHPWRGMGEAEWREHPLIAAAGEVDAVTGACLMIGRALFDALGGFDQQAFAVTLNDVDLCLKARARGLKVVYAPQATLLHKEGQSRRRDDDLAEQVRRERELAVFYDRYPEAARRSVFYPVWLRRDNRHRFGHRLGVGKNVLKHLQPGIEAVAALDMVLGVERMTVPFTRAGHIECGGLDDLARRVGDEDGNAILQRQAFGGDIRGPRPARRAPLPPAPCPWRRRRSAAPPGRHASVRTMAPGRRPGQ